MSYLITVDDSGTEPAATFTDATAVDIVSSMFDGNKAVTGMYSFVQHAGVFLGGMVFQNYRLGQGLNPFS